MLNGSVGVALITININSPSVAAGDKNFRDNVQTGVCSLFLFMVLWLVRWNIVTQPGRMSFGVFLSQGCRSYNPTHTHTHTEVFNLPRQQQEVTDENLLWLIFFFFFNILFWPMCSVSHRAGVGVPMLFQGGAKAPVRQMHFFEDE